LTFDETEDRISDDIAIFIQEQYSSPPGIVQGTLKFMMNTQFKKRFNNIDCKLTLSNIINLREDFINQLCSSIDIEACTLALG
jgi:hypothetical protein